METLNSVDVRKHISNLVSIASKNAKIELEAKLLGGEINTRDQAERILHAVQSLATTGVTEENRATFIYGDGIRVTVMSVENIYKVCTTNSFRGVPLSVERKQRYSELAAGVKDIYNVPDLSIKFTLLHEEPLRKDFTGSPMDAHMVRVMNRKSWIIANGMFRIDMSFVKSKTKNTKSLSDILKQSPTYELEIEIIDKQTESEELLSRLIEQIHVILSAYQQSSFLLTDSNIQNYRYYLEQSRNRFINPVSMERRHIALARENNILRGYTVTNKADGERCMLTVTRDRRLIRWNKPGLIAWTGLTAKDDSHLGDLIDGEYLYDRNLFCIFDVYQYKKKDTTRLPLMVTDEEVYTNPLTSRIGYSHIFVKDIATDFNVEIDKHPFRIETKLFYAGDGAIMEKAINRMLDMKFEYPIDGLIFTPKSTAVAPQNERVGNTWTTVYKWKPPHQNSIDFLVRLQPKESYDPVLDKQVFKGTLYVSREAGSDIIYPCEIMTGEYKPPEIPRDLQRTTDRVPAPFQPLAPKSFEAMEILIPINNRGIPVDSEGNRIEDNTIIECVRDTTNGRWSVMRTRYDKTYSYRVARKPEFGNDIRTANSIWTNLHNPVTEDMLRNAHTRPVEDTFEDDLYYRDKQESHDRNMKEVNKFHNEIKEKLYKDYIRIGDTLLEFAVGRAGDLHKWRKTKPSRVVGIEYSRSNIEAPLQGACIRYIQTQRENPKEILPPALFIVGDMTQPLLEQDNKYIRILANEEPAPTPYLEKFQGLMEFDVISCQFAIHYACESEETFRVFAKNLERHGKGIFFGTCMDGQEVYSLLLGESGHIFRTQGMSNVSTGSTWGEIRKEYADAEEWHEDFGKAIVVKLENFEKPTKEYLVPFEKVKAILLEHGYELMDTNLFRDLYLSQTKYTLDDNHKLFSFLHRTFAFRRIPVSSTKIEVIKEEEEKEDKGKKEDEEKEDKKEDKKEDEDKDKKEKKPRTKRITKTKEEKPEPVIFADSLADYKEFLTSYEAPMEINAITYPTLEHYVQWKKAEKFGDAKMQEAILKSKSALSAKQYGNKVKEVNEEEWDKMKDEVMKTGLKAKFMQHPDIQEKLKSTGTRPIGEANARDKYWSIGTGADTNKTKDPSKWPGKNRLGELLQELRSELKE